MVTLLGSSSYGERSVKIKKSMQQISLIATDKQKKKRVRVAHFLANFLAIVARILNVVKLY